MVVAKLPVPGKVKTRLGKDISDVAAAKFAKASLLDLLDRIDDGMDDSNISKYVLFAPTDAHDAFLAMLAENNLQHWKLRAFHPPANITEPRDLSTGLQHSLIHAPHSMVMFVGSDTPHLCMTDVKECIHALKTMGPNSASVIPARDGGYCLLGLFQISNPNRVFDRTVVQWSCAITLATQLAALCKAGVCNLFISSKVERDVDEENDLIWLREITDGDASLVLPRIRAFFAQHTNL